MTSESLTHSPESTAALGAKLAQGLKPGLITLSGDLGTGKTKFTAGLLQALGAKGPYQSPTFMLMKEYHLPEMSPGGIARVYHADAYRLKKTDFEKLGFQEWLEDPATLTILEWPDRVEDVLPQKRMTVTFEVKGESERLIKINEA